MTGECGASSIRSDCLTRLLFRDLHGVVDARRHLISMLESYGRFMVRLEPVATLRVRPPPSERAVGRQNIETFKRRLVFMTWGRVRRQNVHMSGLFANSGTRFLGECTFRETSCLSNVN